MPENQQLSERELEILRLVATGASNKEIAQTLVISVNTVKVHLRNIFSKLEVSSRTEATMWAVREGIVATSDNEQDIQPEEDASKSKKSFTDIQSQKEGRRRLIILELVLLILLVTSGYGFWLMINAGSASVAMATPFPMDAPRWQELAPMLTARSGFGVATYDGEIYAIAGESVQGVVGVNESYDFIEDSWDTLTPKPIPVTDVQAVSVGGKIYIPGGRLANGAVTDILEVYDPSKDRWELGTPLPVPLSAYALVALEGKIYLFGGWDGNGYLDVVYIYSPDSNLWEEGPSMPTARAFSSAAIIGEKILVVGGTADGTLALSENEEFSPELSLQSWKQRTPLPEERYSMGVASIADTLYLIGGKGKYDSGFTSYGYYSQRDEWQPIETPFEQPLTQMRVTPFQTHLFFIGGRSLNTTVNQNLAFQAIFSTSLPIVR